MGGAVCNHELETIFIVVAIYCIACKHLLLKGFAVLPVKPTFTAIFHGNGR